MKSYFENIKVYRYQAVACCNLKDTAETKGKNTIVEMVSVCASKRMFMSAASERFFRPNEKNRTRKSFKTQDTVSASCI